MSEELQLRVHNPGSDRTLIYLPGLHGDWTLLGGFRRALAGRARLVEMTYPRTLSWSLDDYAQAIEKALAATGIRKGWLLAESFGSQLAWQIVSRSRFEASGIILAGGFVRHPVPAAVRVAARLTGRLSPPLIVHLLHLYARIARVRYRRAPEVLAGMEEFFARRTDLDLKAAKHRLQLIAENDPGATTRALQQPVYALTGLVDPIVPWLPVRRWLKRNCPALREYRIIWRADHTVLATAPKAAADQIIKWIGQPA